MDPATAAALADYDAWRMPGLIDSRVRPVLERSVPELRQGSTFTADDSYGQRLRTKYLDLAASMSVVYTAAEGHSFRVYLGHSRSEAEGAHRKACAEQVEQGYPWSCAVDVVGGDVVITTVGAMRRADDGGWVALTRDELRTGRIAATNADRGPLDPDQVYFQRNVKVVHSETFVTDAQETVRASSLSAAEDEWQVPVTDLRQIARDPVLVIPPPPRDAHGCPATDPDSTVGCA
jgi:hypothetical protein